MSSKEKYDDVSLDKIAVINILNWLDYAGQALIIGDIPTALDDVDMAWAKLPNIVREKMIQPSQQVQLKINAEMISTEEMMGDVRFKQYSQRTINRSQAEISDEIGQSVVRSCIVEIITWLDKYNLYIKHDKVIEATSKKALTEQPPTTALPATLSRETS